MPHVLFAFPPIGAYPLLEPLAELAMRRGHRVTVLAGSGADRAFWLAQHLPARALAPGGEPGPDVPVRELAAVDHRLAGGRGPVPPRAVRRIGGAAAALQQLLTSDPPDVLVVPFGRSGVHRLAHFAARRLGIPTVHVGDGMLPGTLLCDSEGIDGDSAIAHRGTADYRMVTARPALLRAAAAAFLGAAGAPCVPRRAPSDPGVPARLWCGLRALREGPRAAYAAFRAWRDAVPARGTPAADHPALPAPAVAVLLQPANCPRRLLDARPISAAALLDAARIAAAAVDPLLGVVAVLPDGPLGERLREAPAPGAVVGPSSIRSVLATAAAVITVNHPLAGAALLLGRPVVHLGRAVWGVSGVATPSTLGALPEALARALRDERPSLRDRCLTRLLRQDHVWCDRDAPDRN
ncbi:MAG TPA: hypothetical protein VK081_14700, partial [Planctomycetota bacterium]|nr:hypothetical protein [Planctomycetota bacterium]